MTTLIDRPTNGKAETGHVAPTRPVKAKGLKGFKHLGCPYCGGTARLNLDDLRKATCASCRETFAAKTALEMCLKAAKQWQEVIEWVATASTTV